MNVRAKFRVTEKTQMSNGSEVTNKIKLSPVVGGSPENEQFYRWTPGGSIELQVVSAAVGEALEIGKEYYIDFTPAPAAVAAAA